jgi:soluble lytic murein transglycosylase
VEASWHPLESGEPSIDRLWRLGQPLEAWEHWRVHKGGRDALSPQQLLVEGRLRRAVGDHWIGLGQLERASLRLPADQCGLARVLERELHTPAYGRELQAASQQAGVHASLLAAVAKQESRFSPSVRSPVGAVGLLQLMPATAAEVAGEALSGSDLEDPGRNATLGARYLRQLLNQWQGDPLLAVASYNAGPGAVAGWIDARLRQQPELWVEAIPYPETRLYVKKVLGNRWSMAAERPPGCRPLSAPAASPPQPR